jgi:hypothetical protein
MNHIGVLSILILLIVVFGRVVIRVEKSGQWNVALQAKHSSYSSCFTCLPISLMTFGRKYEVFKERAKPAVQRPLTLNVGPHKPMIARCSIFPS